MTGHTSEHITDYNILSDEDPKVLSQNIEVAIHNGWQPHGTLCISPRSDGFRSVYSQVVVKYADRFG